MFFYLNRFKIKIELCIILNNVLLYYIIKQNNTKQNKIMSSDSKNNNLNDFFDLNDFLNIDIDTNKHFEKTINEIKTQYEIKNNENMCTGICYYAALHLDLLVKYFENNDTDAYRKLYFQIINMGNERKLNKSEIHYDGEYIDSITVKNDFLELYKNINYYEYIIGNFVDGNSQQIDKITNDITNINIGGFIIISKNKETIIITKIKTDTYLVLDSHISIHGTIKEKNLLKYIFINYNFEGVLNIGIKN